MVVECARQAPVHDLLEDAQEAGDKVAVRLHILGHHVLKGAQGCAHNAGVFVAQCLATEAVNGRGSGLWEQRTRQKLSLPEESVPDPRAGSSARPCTVAGVRIPSVFVAQTEHHRATAASDCSLWL